MKICKHCFTDEELIPIIQSKNEIGDCELCKRQNVPIYDTEKDSVIGEMFNEFLKIYTPAPNLIQQVPHAEIFDIERILKENWSIFNEELNLNQIKDFLISLSKTNNTNITQFLNHKVGIKELYDEDYKIKNQLLVEGTWNKFVDSIKYKNRLYAHHFNEELFKKYLSHISKTYYKGDVFFRARISHTEKPLPHSKIGAPPPDKSADGRVNAKGITCLYLSKEPQTCALEVRALTNNFVSIGKFELQKDIKVVDLNKISKISPFKVNLDPRGYAINFPVLIEIKNKISQPKHYDETLFDYLPTQYIADFIRSIEEDGNQIYAGIEYPSVMDKESGINLAIFNPELFKCKRVKSYQIIGTKHITKPNLPKTKSKNKIDK